MFPISRNVLRCLVLGVWLAAGAAGAQTPGYTWSNAFPNLVFSNPVCLTTPPGETNRLFIVEKHGRIIVITNLASPTRTVFLDISPRVTVVNTSESADVNGEEGLLGLAFHPGYTSNRFFYVFYTGQATNGTTGLHDILARFEISPGNTNLADSASEVRLIAQYDQQNNHNAGDIHFGPDGYLYVPFGDEGGGNDDQNNSQIITNDFFSAISRIDVDQRPGNLAPHPHAAIVAPTNYAIPSDNPFIGATLFNGLPVNSNLVRTEFWVVGLRNPWRMSYDAGSNLWYCADVGQGAREEIDILVPGANYGWAYREGTIAGPKSASAPPGFSSVNPIIEYGHTNGGFGTRIAVIGGPVYRGGRFPDLAGLYVFGDYGSGEIWTTRYDGSTATPPQLLFADAGVAAFGPDPRNGDVLYADLQSGNNSVIKRIVSINPVPLITSLSLLGGNAVISGIRGTSGGNYTVLRSADLSLPLASWTPVATNSFDMLGNFFFTNAVAPGDSQLFYRVRVL
jgi:glucose/arabinose dehydrogenase